MIERLKEHKKVILGVVIAILIILIAIFGLSLFKNQSNKEKLESNLKEMGKDFYENYYYEQSGKTEEERKSFLARFKEIGIKINLDNLGRYNSEANQEKIKMFVNNKTKQECDKETTRVVIYPKDNYTKTDYDLKVELDCGFED